MEDKEALEMLNAHAEFIEIKIKLSTNDKCDSLNTDIYVEEESLLDLNLKLLFMFATDYISKYIKGEIKKWKNYGN